MEYGKMTYLTFIIPLKVPLFEALTFLRQTLPGIIIWGLL